MKRISLLTAFLLSMLSAGGTVKSSPAGRTQEQEQVRGAPADADEVREQIAAVEKRLPQLSDRAAGLYFLATSKQHLGETLDALKLLKECISFHEGFDPAGSPELRVLKGSKEFDELVNDVHRDFPAVAQAKVAFVTEERDLVPEGLAYDSKQNVYYLSSLYRRKIVRIDADGKDSDFVPAGRDHLPPIFGIRANSADGTVWANSWDEKLDRSELLHFDASGKLLGRYTPNDSAKHGFNDLVILENGDIVLTDSVSNQVFRFNPDQRSFVAVAVHRTLSAPNGIALSDEARAMYVADDFGVVRLDLKNGESADVNPGVRNTLAGIDGLYWHNGALIAVQNGIGSPRIAAFRLSKEGNRVTQTTVLENRSAFTVTPSTGAIHGNNFYFIANSQADNLNGDHLLDVTRQQPVLVGVLHLP